MAKLLVKYGSDNEEAKNCTLLDLDKGFFAIVDNSLFEYLSQWRWYAKQSGSCWYAVRKVTLGKHERLIRMHRQLTDCPDGYDVHHINGDSLDNRICNLLPCSPETHQALHNNPVI